MAYYSIFVQFPIRSCRCPMIRLGNNRSRQYNHGRRCYCLFCTEPWCNILSIPGLLQIVYHHTLHQRCHRSPTEYRSHGQRRWQIEHLLGCGHFDIRVPSKVSATIESSASHEFTGTEISSFLIVPPLLNLLGFTNYF